MPAVKLVLWRHCVDECCSGASRSVDVREPISLHQAEYMSNPVTRGDRNGTKVAKRPPKALRQTEILVFWVLTGPCFWTLLTSWWLFFFNKMDRFPAFCLSSLYLTCLRINTLEKGVKGSHNTDRTAHFPHVGLDKKASFKIRFKAGPPLRLF